MGFEIRIRGEGSEWGWEFSSWAGANDAEERHVLSVIKELISALNALNQPVEAAG